MDATLSSISRGFYINYYKSAEDSARKNVSWLGAWFFQTMQMSQALEFSKLALSVAGSLKVMPITDFHCRVASVITILYCKNVNPDTFPVPHKIGRFVYDHIGTASQLVILVSSVSLAFFGQPLVGGITAAWVAFGFVQRSQLVDLGKLNFVATCIGLGATIVPYALNTILHGGLITRALLISSFAAIILGMTTSYGTPVDTYEVPETEKTKISILNIKSLNLDIQNLRVATGHINVVEKIFDAPLFENNQIVTDFEALKGKGKLQSDELEKRLEKVDRFIHRENRENVSAYHYVKAGLTFLVGSVTRLERKLDKTENQQKALKMYKHAFDYISNLPEEEKIEQFIEMGIYAHDVSAHDVSAHDVYAHKQKLQELYYTATANHPGLAFPNKIYRCLDTLRAKIFHEVKNKFSLISEELLPDEDSMAYNFGLPWMKLLPEGGVPDFDKLIKRVFGIPYRTDIWSEYTLENILQELQNMDVSPDWFKNQYTNDYKEKNGGREPSFQEMNTFNIDLFENKSKYDLFAWVKLGIFE